MRLDVPAAEQAWAYTIAVPAASLAPCYEAPLHPPLLRLLYAIFK
jgi:hypothetical protein